MNVFALYNTISNQVAFIIEFVFFCFFGKNMLFKEKHFTNEVCKVLNDQWHFVVVEC